MPSCQPSGMTAAGKPCTGDGECVPGTLCLGICTAFCDADAECTSVGGICALSLTGTAGPLPGVHLCSDNCSPIGSTGCPGAGNGCTFDSELTGAMRTYTYCTQVGTGVKGAACTTDFNCAPGFGCVNNGTTHVCLQYCDVNNNSCGCNALENSKMVPYIVNGKTLGVCP